MTLSTPIDRRRLLQGAGAAAALGVTAPLLRPAAASPAPAAQTQTLPVSGQVPGVYRTKVGAIEVTSLLDGGIELGLDLFAKMPLQEAETLQKQAFVAPGAVKAYINAFVVKLANGEMVLIDSGGRGMSKDTGNMLRNLRTAGFVPDQFSKIFLTHGHIDHVSGLIDDEGQPVFPRASVYICDAELQFWYDDAVRSKAPKGAKPLFEAARKALDPYKKTERIQTFKMGADLIQGLSAIALPGHTPGHNGFRLSDAAEQMVIWGDIIHAPVLQFANPEWSIAFDTDAGQAIETRRRIMNEVANDRLRVAGMHLGFPGIGHVAQQGFGYDFVPQVWEMW